MTRFGNSSLLSVGEVFHFGLASPKCFINTIFDRIDGKAKLRFPRRIVLHLTNRCNMACPMCSIGVARQHRQKDHLGDISFEIVD